MSPSTSMLHKSLKFPQGIWQLQFWGEAAPAACVCKEPGCCCRSQEWAEMITNKCKAQLEKPALRAFTCPVFKKKRCWKSGAACANTLRNRDQYWYLLHSLLVCISAGEAVEQQRGFFLSANHPKGSRSCSPIPGGQEGHRAHRAAAAAPQSSGP